MDTTMNYGNQGGYQGSSGLQMTYTVDIVFCIDSTGSMQPVLDTVKNSAIHFYDDLMRIMTSVGKKVDSVRVKIISFRDYIADGENAMMETSFFTLPQDTYEFSNTVRGIEPFGGGDEPEDGLEALGYAIRSDWSQVGKKRRQIIVVWSDASAHPLGFGSSAPSYPRGMARNFAELTEWWGNRQIQPYMRYTDKRLILYTPENAAGWSDVIRNWSNVVHYPSRAGEGLQELSYQEILSVIAQSI